MDDILSSIRQIIADDDAGAAAAKAKRAAEAQAAAASKPAPAPAPAPEPDPEPQAAADDDLPSFSPADETAENRDAEPLALSPEQIIADEMGETQDDTGTDDPDLSEWGLTEEDVAPAAPAEEPQPEEPRYEEPVEEPAGESGMVMPDDVAFAEPAADDPAPQPEPEPRMESASSLPDKNLSADIAERLVEPAVEAATHKAFSQLNALALSGQQRTVEDLIREMLRPMLKEWLDDNLPSMVERLVQREIERVSRGR
ncbi:PopZ family protein [Cucumibacter marinus]|uniref:PopZ family protein n=1 Tax=Cucumibacter marinus TaxID=1121252 RepID=UPI0003F745CB|nr:DUF2497 domain-containing protein [Cucumibacter marinus]